MKWFLKGQGPDSDEILEETKAVCNTLRNYFKESALVAAIIPEFQAPRYFITDTGAFCYTSNSQHALYGFESVESCVSHTEQDDCMKVQGVADLVFFSRRTVKR